ncbi:hypothetical protein G8770_03715 [Aestuariicella hydrocarbonica]|uniref:Phage protein n=1 Tax=Pseudomaricurvus hydrocarbonicus TaxID=1470433 RepID=A0A9E5JQ98_9GAMM|nr:hypothetical protein [Aestuariicella hydrocarbonica]NHO64653.1 hypothetical protein [Aestuariicella hydrocarbonica]
MSETNVMDFLEELGAGIFKEKLAHALSEAALGTIIHGNGTKKAKVSIELTFKQIGENDQVSISHKLAHITPTKRGKKSEEDTTETAMFVGRGGVLSVSQPREELRGQFALRQDSDGKSLN